MGGGSEYIVDIESIMPALWSVADVDDDDAAGLFVRNSGSSLESSDELVVVESINDLDAEDLDAEDLDAKTWMPKTSMPKTSMPKT